VVAVISAITVVGIGAGLGRDSTEDEHERGDDNYEVQAR
jgi:hypothetical protein